MLVTIAQSASPSWGGVALLAAVVSVVGSAVVAVVTKLMDRGNSEHDRRDKRRQVLFDAYAAWLTSFEETLQDYAGYYGPIAWEHQGHGSQSKSEDAKPKDDPTPLQKFTASSWRLRLLERDAHLAKEIEELSRAFDYEAEDYFDLVGKALGWSDEMKGLRERAGKVIQQMQSLYLQQL